MKSHDFLLRVVALRDAQNRYNNTISAEELADNLQEVLDLEQEIDDIISRILTGEDKLE